MGDLIRGATCFWRGLGLIGRPGIRTYAFAPMAIGLVVLGALIFLAVQSFDGVVAWVHDAVPAWLDWLDWLLWILFAIAAIGGVAFSYVIVAGLIASPFNGLLAEAVEARVTGVRATSSPLLTALRRLPGVIVQELKKVLYALLLAIPFLLLFVIPGVNVIAPVTWFLFNAWITALAFTDYPMDNAGLPFREMRRRLRSRPALWLGFGGMSFLALTVPVLNLFALPGAVCGATLLWVEHLRSEGRR